VKESPGGKPQVMLYFIVEFLSQQLRNSNYQIIPVVAIVQVMSAYLTILILISSNLKNECYSERRCCVSDQQPEFSDLKATSFSNKLLRSFQTAF
jgi:hypothetical protein